MTVIQPLTSHQGTRWPRSLVALVIARAVNRLGSFAMAFMAVALVEVHGASLATAGAVVTAFGVATIPSRLLGGRMADTVGRRATIVIGLLACAAAQLVIAASPGITGALIGATLLGLAYEIYEPASQALIAESVEAERRPQAFGLYGAAMAVAGVAAGALAALVGGIDLRFLFVADALTCLCAAALVLALVRDTTARSDGMVRTGPSPWRDRRLLTMLALGTGFATAWILSTIALPLTVSARGHDAAATGWLLLVAALVTIAGQRLLRGAASRPFTLIRAGLVLMAVGFAVIAYAAPLPLLALGTAIVALGEVLLLGPPIALVAGLATDASRAGYLAAYGTCWGIAQTVGPMLATGLMSHGTPTVWLTGAALCLVLTATTAAATAVCSPR
ncbi:putative MFS family arabinose efflux permease [Nocardioides albertanoniae]|uniref:Putative MFS family arabinose efflux permease n=1 Tax=Nocardioides albertanoniae TaxID=1175486 RepID=A0A543AD50_9ACTN|nr:MFS transporter [Nocardioides albertanoniae]TQL70508.1 putative MFS family arabinose efflux permease [Nocardioides albertanoniae]